MSYLQHSLQARAGGLFVLVEGVGVDVQRSGGLTVAEDARHRGHIRAAAIIRLAAVKLSQFSWENEFLRKQQSCAAPLRRTGGGEIENLLAVRTEHGEHGVSRLLLLRLLGVAVGAL